MKAMIKFEEYLNGAVGSGKTTYIINNLLPKLENDIIDKEKIFCVGFLKTTIENIRERGKKVYSSSVLFKTIDSICFSALKNKYNFKHIEDIENVITKIKINICKKYGLFYSITGEGEGNLLFSEYDKLRNIEFDKDNEEIIGLIKEKHGKKEYKEALLEYEKTLKTLKIQDFTNLKKEFWEGEFLFEYKTKNDDVISCLYIVVDEAQDLTPLIIGILQIQEKYGIKIYGAGDIAQTILFPNGVKIEYIKALEVNAKKVVYKNNVKRTPKNIFNNYCLPIFNLMKYKPEERPFSENNNLGFVEHFKLRNEDEIIKKIVDIIKTNQNKSIFILTFRNADTWFILNKLIEYKIIIDTITEREKFFNYYIFKTVVSELRGKDIKTIVEEGKQSLIYKFLLNKNEKGAFDFFYNSNDLKSCEEILTNKIIKVLEKYKLGLKEIKSIEILNNVKVDTIFQAKGREADIIIIYDIFPRVRFLKYEELEELLHIQYVATTRTKEKLIFISCKKDGAFKKYFGW